MSRFQSFLSQISDAAKNEPDSFATLVLSGLMTVLVLIVLV